ncbi:MULTISPECIES: hypothetical protein [unclassified Gemella]|uniref:hypothetical protein n=1 Tax=unclassified Gemella TaxID=2624949 RepID=UPI0015CFFD55|nr:MULTISPECIES: hypothetical protein [unclassified Gemella]MBF0710579.1 hypothetical protein [Gemella sp. GL1.1]NYS27923.1 hypothetical protein [Gemella sp. GL1]
MSPRTGRPPKGEESKTERFEIRVSKKEKQQIQRLADKLQLSKAETVLKSINTLEESIKE